jgi:hypothetical protein
MTTDYQKQAEDFLKETGTTLSIERAVPQKVPTWGEGKDAEKHIHYVVTLENKKHKYTFDFWGSIRDWEIVQLAQYRNSAYSSQGYKLRDFLKENGLLANQYKTTKDIEEMLHDFVKPKAYDIIACINPMYEADFEDWCASFGYDTDSIKSEKTYKACLEEDRNIRRLFTHEELEKLSEIQ